MIYIDKERGLPHIENPKEVENDISAEKVKEVRRCACGI